MPHAHQTDKKGRVTSVWAVQPRADGQRQLRRLRPRVAAVLGCQNGSETVETVFPARSCPIRPPDGTGRRMGQDLRQDRAGNAAAAAGTISTNGTEGAGRANCRWHPVRQVNVERAGQRVTDVERALLVVERSRAAKDGRASPPLADGESSIQVLADGGTLDVPTARLALSNSRDGRLGHEHEARLRPTER
eukprot:5147667-Prymnesium_polylepis.1